MLPKDLDPAAGELGKHQTTLRCDHVIASLSELQSGDVGRIRSHETLILDGDTRKIAKGPGTCVLGGGVMEEQSVLYFLVYCTLYNTKITRPNGIVSR